MNPDAGKWNIDQFFKAAGDFKRPLFFIAHQDDESSSGGLIQRLGSKTRFVWLTNGDGLWFQDNIPPKEYGQMRIKEAVQSVGALGIPESHTRCLEFSEVRIYRHMAYLSENPYSIKWHKPFWDEIRLAVRDALFEAEPDCVFTGAWQGGHPEHDLTHYFTRLALDEYRLKTGNFVPFFHLPEYEYVILVAFRFNPFYKGHKIRFKLTQKELETKVAALRLYKSQEELMIQFEKVLGFVGKLGALVGKGRSIEDFLGTEEFGAVPEDLDYTRSTHVFESADYIQEDFDNIPISFNRSILPIIRAFPRDGK